MNPCRSVHHLLSLCIVTILLYNLPYMDGLSGSLTPAQHVSTGKLPIYVVSTRLVQHRHTASSI